jgi:hypothetical protein
LRLANAKEEILFEGKEKKKKLSTHKCAGGVTQEVEHLPNKNKALSSNPRTAKKKKKRISKNFSFASPVVVRFLEWSC